MWLSILNLFSNFFIPYKDDSVLQATTGYRAIKIIDKRKAFAGKTSLNFVARWDKRDIETLLTS